MKKLLFVSLLFMLGLPFFGHACNNSTIEIVSQTDNGNATITYCLSLTTELESTDQPFFGFVLQFQSCSNTASVLPGAYPATISTATNGVLLEPLTGLTGTEINSVANNSDWDLYEGFNNVLSYESNALVATDDVVFDICITVDQCVETILFDAHVSSGANDCKKTVVTNSSCTLTTTQACDDGIACTGNDQETVLIADGTICVPCQGTDQDCSTGPTLVFPCDDGNPNTIDDSEVVLGCDGSICIPCNGIPVDCNTPGATTIQPCDDGDPCTINDTEVILTAAGIICEPCMGILNPTCDHIQGKVFADEIENCMFDMGETGLSNLLVQAVGNLTFYGLTNENGEYNIPAFPDTYELSIVNYNDQIWSPCLPIQNVTVTPNIPTIADFSLQKIIDCPLLEVEYSVPLLRRCFENYVNVSYCNSGSVEATDAYIQITLPDLISIVDAPPYTDLGNGVFEFAIGDLAFGECGSFNILISTSCDAELGQTLCAVAEIFPQAPCVPPSASWSGASLEITTTCDGDQIQFQITNTGTANMTTSREYIVIEDGVVFMTSPTPIQLDQGESTPFLNFPENGTSYILQVQQVEEHPGHSMPSLAVEGCGEDVVGPFSNDFVSQFPLDDADSFVDIDCHEVIGAWDPNDKNAEPIGYDMNHFIRKNTDIEYFIRFQNTGTDTAFNIVIEDVLSEHLDITTLRPGVSSHPYAMEILGSDTLHFIFENIMLPDSNVNEVASHGFVKFTIAQQLDLPVETIIENTAGIFFDFNEAVITNTVFHTIGENFILTSVEETLASRSEIEVIPNPFTNEIHFTLKGIAAKKGILHLYNLQGQKMLTQAFDGSSVLIQGTQLLSGPYLYKIDIDGEFVGSGKLIKQ